IDFHRGHVTLRGAGPDQTFLIFSDGSACNGLQGNICLSQNNFNSATPLYVVDWTAGYTQGTTQITLACGGAWSPSPYNLTANSNQLIFLDQLDDQTQGPTLPPDGIFVSSDCSWQGDPCTAFGRLITNATYPLGEHNIAGQIEVHTVTAINGNVVTISPGLRNTNWSGNRYTTAWWDQPITDCDHNGIENLSLDHSGSTRSTGILMFYCSNSWVKNVRSIKSNARHVWLGYCQHCEVRDSYFFAT